MKKSIFLVCLFVTFGSFGPTILAQSKSKLFKKSIDIGRAKDVRTDISFFAGELNINSETTMLAECFYGYKDGFIKPDMTYREVGTIGYLSVVSEKKDKGIINDETNRWNLSLNKDVKNSLSINLKAGKSTIDLEGCNLSSFDYKMTAGESKINLRNTSVPQVKFNLLAGESLIDLSGKWKNDGVADIKGGVGEVTVKVPYKTGVIIYVTGLLGDVSIPFFDRDGDAYVNDSYKKSKNTLTIYIHGAIGQINVKMEE